MCDSIHDLATAVHAVASGEILWIRCLHGLGVRNDLTIVQSQVRNVFQEGKLLLAERTHYHVNVERKFASGNGTERASAR